MHNPKTRTQVNWLTKNNKIAAIAAARPSAAAAIRSSPAVVSIVLVLIVALFTHPGAMQSTEEPTPIPPMIGPPPASTTAWEPLAPGLERRVFLPDDVYWSLSLMVLRVDPEYYRFVVHYTPGERTSTGLWWWRLPSAQAFINANFFDVSHEIVGLLVASGQVYGTPYVGYGGTFVVLNDLPFVLPNTDPLPEGIAYQQLVQGTPMLVVDGESVYTQDDENSPAGR